MLTHSTYLWFIVGLVVIAVIYLISLYNQLVNVKNNVGKNWSNIDVLLKQRNDELPKLIDACKVYMTFEKETLEQMINARNAAVKAQAAVNLPDLNAAESIIHQGLGRLFALAENYPDLKTNKSFIQLQSRISDLENQIADRRELYNESVKVNNVVIEQFPSNIIAGMFKFQHAQLLEFVAERKDVNVANLFKS